MKYLRKFETASEYDSFTLDHMPTPNVSLVKETDQLHYNKKRYTKLISNGFAYIKTDYALNIYDQIEVKYEATSGYLPAMILGVRDSNVFGLILQTQKDKGYVAWGESTTSLVNMYMGDVENPAYLGMKKNSDTSYASYLIKGSYSTLLHSHGVPSSKTATTKLCIFTSSMLDSEEVDTRMLRGAIYYVRIIDSRTGEVKLLLEPELQNDEPGMIDRVSGTFYGNVNSQGVFTLE